LSSQNQPELAAVTAKGDQMIRYVKQNSSPPYWEQEKFGGLQEVAFKEV
jgi:hypothetical protein